MGRYLIVAFAVLALLAFPSFTGPVSPYTSRPASVPTYERHVGSDESAFDAIYRRIGEEENRRRADDQESRLRMIEHEKAIAALDVHARIVAERVTKIEDRMFYVIGLLISLCLTSAWNAIISQRIHRRLPKQE